MDFVYFKESELKSRMGEWYTSDDEKCSKEWRLKINGRVYSVYNWEGYSEWNIGGESSTYFDKDIKDFNNFIKYKVKEEPEVEDEVEEAEPEVEEEAEPEVEEEAEPEVEEEAEPEVEVSDVDDNDLFGEISDVDLSDIEM
jgi:hypothetical protein